MSFEILKRQDTSVLSLFPDALVFSCHDKDGWRWSKTDCFFTFLHSVWIVMAWEWTCDLDMASQEWWLESSPFVLCSALGHIEQESNSELHGLWCSAFLDLRSRGGRCTYSCRNLKDLRTCSKTMHPGKSPPDFDVFIVMVLKLAYILIF